MNVRLRNEYFALPAPAVEEVGGLGGKVVMTGIRSPVGSATPEKERSEIYRREVPDFLLLNPSAYQTHNAKSLHKTLGRKKKKIS